jgi:hypothetical protein
VKVEPAGDATDEGRGESVSAEVGDDGGSPGDVELITTVIGTGSEAGETWRPAEQEKKDVVRDETGEGRRSP